MFFCFYSLGKIFALTLSFASFPEKSSSINHGVSLCSHRATYDVKIENRENSLGTEATGSMTVELKQFDTDWITNQSSHMLFKVGDDEVDYQTSTLLSSVESNIGTLYNFSAHAKENDTIVEEIKGMARLTVSQGPGTLSFEEPVPLTIDLPPSTLFPLAYLAKILQTAQTVSGKKIELMKDIIFDANNSIKDIVCVETIIFSADDKIKEFSSSDHSIYKPRRLWYVETSAFSYEKKELDELPLYKTHMLISDQGITHEMTVDYGEFKMIGKLNDLKIYTQP